MRWFNRILLIGLLLPLALHAAEQSKPRVFDATLPIKLEADKGEIDTKQGVSIYRGNVKISQGEIRIEGDELRIKSIENNVSSARVSGSPAEFHDLTDPARPVSALAPIIIYKVSNKILTLQEGAELKQGQNTMKGDTIDYQIDTGRVVAEGSTKRNERIEILLFPEQLDPKK